MLDFCSSENQEMDDLNIIHGGDSAEIGPLKGDGCASLGDLILTKLKKGGNSEALVSFLINRSEIFAYCKSLLKDQRLNEPNMDFQRSSNTKYNNGESSFWRRRNPERRHWDYLREST